MRKAFKAILPYCLSVAVMACAACVSQYNFEKTPSATNVANGATSAPSQPSCPEALRSSTDPIRILFMVDNSGSTAVTDPDHYYSVRTIQEFLEKYSGKENLKYSFGMFAREAFVYDLPDQKFEPMADRAFGTADEVETALETYDSTMSPRGHTGYAAALSALQHSISREGASGKKFVVVFMSDGMPTDVPPPINSNLRKMVSRLETRVEKLGGELSLSAVYFGPESDRNSIRHMRTLAKSGAGQFVDTNRVDSLSIDDIVTLPGTTCSGS